MNKILEAHERGDYARPLGNVPAVIGRATSLPATTGISDPFLAFAQAESGQDILGKLLRFSKGDYIADKTEIPVGTDMLAAVDAIIAGFVRWSGKQQAERHLGRISDGFHEPTREELGHLDESQWERDRDGRPQDPWAKMRYLPLKRIADGELFTLAMSGKGRSGEAIGRLVGAYGRSRNRDDGYPIIKLSTDSYEHREFGRIKFPVLPIVGWRPKHEFGELETGGDADVPERTDHVASVIEEEIPF